jgi:DNA-binding MurR/RpiR family transcriptional regulator
VAEHFHGMGAHIVALVDSAEAPVAKLANHVLQFPIESASPFDSFTAATSLCNLLLAGVASRRPRVVLETLQRGEGMWKSFEIFSRS